MKKTGACLIQFELVPLFGVFLDYAFGTLLLQ